MNGKTIFDFMSDSSLWGIDLTTIPNFYEQVKKNVDIINNKGQLI